MEHKIRHVELADAAERLEELVDAVFAGEGIAICKDGVPVALLLGVAGQKRPIRFGLLEGRIVVSRDFDSQLPGSAFELSPD